MIFLDFGKYNGNITIGLALCMCGSSAHQFYVGDVPKLVTSEVSTCFLVVDSCHRGFYS